MWNTHLICFVLISFVTFDFCQSHFEWYLKLNNQVVVVGFLWGILVKFTCTVEKTTTYTYKIVLFFFVYEIHNWWTNNHFQVDSAFSTMLERLKKTWWGQQVWERKVMVYIHQNTPWTQNVPQSSRQTHKLAHLPIKSTIQNNNKQIFFSVFPTFSFGDIQMYKHHDNRKTLVQFLSKIWEQWVFKVNE